jgi:hypothetical protein
MVANLTTFCFVGFGTDRLRRQDAMKTAGRENPNRGVTLPRNRAPGSVGQNKSRSIKWAAKQEKVQPKVMCFFLTSPFIELTRSLPLAWPIALWTNSAVILLGPALMANSLCPGQEKHAMCEQEVQIGNPDLVLTNCAA